MLHELPRARVSLFERLERASRPCSSLLTHPRVRHVAACLDWLRAELAAGHERASLPREVHAVCAQAAAAVDEATRARPHT